MKNIKKSYILNISIVFLVILMTIFMLERVTFMPRKDLLMVSKFENFKFFTIDSNILLGISSLILLIFENKLMKNKIKEIPNWVYIFKMMSISAMFVTFIISLCFLAPLYGFYGMYNNVNLFFHLIIPILGIISYFL